MAHFLSMFDHEHLGAWDLQGRDVVVTISAVKPGTVGGHQGKKKDRKPILSFEGKDKTMACNVTNARAIAAMYGSEVKAWIGKRITIYPTTTVFGRETVDCIRVRPGIPNGKARDGEIRDADPATRDEMRSKQDRAAGRVDPEVGEVPAEDEPGGERDGEP